MKKENNKWVLTITLLAFIISIIFSILSEIIMPNVNLILAIFIMFIFIAIGIIFDILGVAVATSDEEPLHCMNSKKMKGASMAVILQKNASKVSSFCNDVIGDVCGIVSGSAGVYVASKIATIFNLNLLIVSLLITGILSSLTIGGKAIGKSFAMNNCTNILLAFSKFLSNFYKNK